MNGTALLAVNLVLSGMPELQRVQNLKPYFEPKLGEIVSIEKMDLIQDWRKAAPAMVRGFIKVNPPKGNCFTITPFIDRPDEIVCWNKPRALGFYLTELNEKGQVSWKIKTDKSDQGLTVFWPTPIRVAQVLYSEPKPIQPKKLDYLSKKIELISCNYREDLRQIELGTLTNDTWKFKLAGSDVKPTRIKSPPNLQINRNERVWMMARSESTDIIEPEIEAPTSKPGDPVTTHWVVSKSGTYEVKSDHFSVGDQTDGLVGTCRYRLPKKLKRGGQEDGEVECHNTLEFEVVYFRLSCGPLETNY